MVLAVFPAILIAFLVAVPLVTFVAVFVFAVVGLVLVF